VAGLLAALWAPVRASGWWFSSSCVGGGSDFLTAPDRLPGEYSAPNPIGAAEKVSPAASAARTEPSPASEPPAFEHEALAEGVLLFRPARTGPEATNSLVVEQALGLVVIEAQPALPAARALLAAIREVSGKPVRFVVVSHPHVEVLGGLQAFEGAEVIATAAAAAALADPAFDFGAEMRALAPDAAAWSEPPRPRLDLVIDGRVVLDDPARPVTLLPTAQAHSPGGLLVRLMEQDVTYAGPLVFDDIAPFGAQANIGNWLGAINQLMREAPRIVVPLRGAGAPASALRERRDALAWLRGKVEEGLIDRLPPEEVRTRVLDDPERARWFGPSPRFLESLVTPVIDEALAFRRKHGRE